MVMCEWTLADVKNRASNKAFAKICMLKFYINDHKRSLVDGTYGGITYEEAQQVLEGYRTELKIWNYITELIEKSNKN